MQSVIARIPFDGIVIQCYGAAVNTQEAPRLTVSFDPLRETLLEFGYGLFALEGIFSCSAFAMAYHQSLALQR